MIPWLYKWLPVIFGCHCRPERSFSFRGKPFPICARCTGELVGMVLGLVVCWFYLPPTWVPCVLLLPMILDGFWQLLTHRESTNPRRFATGSLFGYALVALLFISSLATIQLGIRIGNTLIP